MDTFVQQATAEKAVALLKKSYPPDCPEIWADIKGYEGNYQISTYGRVKSLERHVPRRGINKVSTKYIRERFLKNYIGTDGYCYFFIAINGKGKHFAAHRLVAIHFLLNPENKREVNHLDRIRTNPHVSNLAWVTPQENILYTRDLGVPMACSFGEKNHAAKLNTKQVLEIRDMEGTHTAIAALYGVTRRAISAIKTRRNWRHLC